MEGVVGLGRGVCVCVRDDKVVSLRTERQTCMQDANHSFENFAVLENHHGGRIAVQSR